MTKSSLAKCAIALIATAAIFVASSALSDQNSSGTEAKIDQIFAKWSTSSPGCAVGASVHGTPVLAKAYGMADLEHDVKNTPETIFEAGSVSKQFTAAAVLFLARDGKLLLDDPVRKYIPELPDYGQPLTIRHMLTHTSGLRDWGSVAGIAGWPRTSRAHTHAHVLDIVSRQRALNFAPGTSWSYSNTGYNLAAILVSRVSGMSFGEFSQRRLFAPLGMTRTSWRDDHRRIVKDRAIAYSDGAGGFRILMPFEDVHGNGGLLTTVGDLLKWNANFASHIVGDQSFSSEQERPGRFSDGRAHDYALGLRVRQYKGVREIAHSGSTAGYQAYLARYPDQQVSVAVLCNVSSASAAQYSNAVADLYLANSIKPATAPAAKHVLTEAEIAAVTGRYRNTLTGEPLDLVREKDTLRVERGAALVAISPARFVMANGASWDLNLRAGTARMTDAFGSVETYERVSPVTPSPEQLKELVGTYVSDEAEAMMTVAIDDKTLVLKRRPDTTISLTPLYRDAFSGQLGTVVFRREGGRVIAFTVSQDRVWDLRFTRRADVVKSSSAP